MEELEERWLPYPGYAGFYEVSTWGNVYSMPRPTTPGGILGLTVSVYGYRIAALSKYGRISYRRVGRMVLETFAGPCPPGQEACHGPAGKGYDGLDNVYWGTRERNMGEDRVRDGTSNQGERCGAAKLTAEKVIELRRRYAAGESQRALGREFGVDQSVVSDAVRGVTWKYLVGEPPVQPGPGQPRQAKLTEAIVLECRRRYAAGETQVALAAEFGVVPSAISQVIHGRKWRNLPGAVPEDEDGRARPKTSTLEQRQEWGRKGAFIRWADIKPEH